MSESDAGELLKDGWRSRDEDQPELAHDCFRKSLEAAQRREDQTDIARAKLALANNVLHFCPDYEDDPFTARERLCGEALRLFQVGNDVRGIADALRLRASTAHHDEAKTLLEESLEVARQAGYAKGVIRALAALGNHYDMGGKRAHGNVMKYEALQLARSAGDDREVATVLESVAISFEGNDEERRAVFDELLALLKELDLKASRTKSLVLYALFACDDNDYDRKEQLLNDAMLLARELGNTLQESTCLELLARVARDRGDIGKAESLEFQSREIAEPLDSPPGLDEAFANDDHEHALHIIRKWFGSNDPGGDANDPK